MNRVKSIAIWTLHILLSAMFVFQGVSKLLSSPSWVSRFKAWGYPDSFYLVVGAIEVVGALFLLIPKFAGPASLGLMIVMVGASVTHAVHAESQIATTLILMALLGWVAYIRRLTFREFQKMFTR